VKRTLALRAPLAAGAVLLAQDDVEAVIRPLTLEELVLESPTVVRGQVLSVTPHWDV
jgi:hypothetical protein